MRQGAKDGIVATVIGTIIAAGILAVWKDALTAVLRTLRWIWAALTYPVGIPVWLLLLVALVVIAAFRRRGPHTISWGLQGEDGKIVPVTPPAGGGRALTPQEVRVFEVLVFADGIPLDLMDLSKGLEWSRLLTAHTLDGLMRLRVIEAVGVDGAVALSRLGVELAIQMKLVKPPE